MAGEIMEEIKPILKYPQGNNGVIGNDQSVKIDAICDSKQKLVWETSDEKVISVDQKGNVTGKKEGTDTGNFYYAKIEAKSRKTDPFMALAHSMCIEDQLDNSSGTYDDLPVITG
jgi:hypothetical protein